MTSAGRMADLPAVSPARVVSLDDLDLRTPGFALPRPHYANHNNYAGSGFAGCVN